MKQRRGKRRPCGVRVGALQRPRDVAPGRVPVQLLDGPDDPEPQESDLPSEVIAQAKRIARREGTSLERMLERFICQRLREEGESWKADPE